MQLDLGHPQKHLCLPRPEDVLQIVVEPIDVMLAELGREVDLSIFISPQIQRSLTNNCFLSSPLKRLQPSTIIVAASRSSCVPCSLSMKILF